MLEFPIANIRDVASEFHEFYKPEELIYAERPDEIIVIAVPHLRRRPGYWRERLKTLKP